MIHYQSLCDVVFLINYVFFNREVLNTGNLKRVIPELERTLKNMLRGLEIKLNIICTHKNTEQDIK